MLKDTPYWPDLAEAVEKYRVTKSLNPIEVALTKLLVNYAEQDLALISAVDHALYWDIRSGRT